MDGSWLARRPGLDQIRYRADRRVAMAGGLQCRRVQFGAPRTASILGVDHVVLVAERLAGGGLDAYIGRDPGADNGTDAVCA